MSSFEMNLSNTDDIIDDIIINNILKSIYKIKDNNFSKTINDYLSKIISIFDIIINSLNIHINSKNEIEKAQRKDENTIRNLYEKYFHEQLINEILENKILNLTKKEKEYELLKQKTGAIISNGKVICNDRKENEIIILRTENSLLKSTIKNNEDLITEKNDIINNLNNDILLYRNEIEELHKMKNGEYSSFSNINININESKHNYKTKIINNSNRKHKSLHKENNCPNNIMYSSYKNNTKLMNKAKNDSFQKYKKVKALNNNEKTKEKSNPKSFRKSNDYTIDINSINNNSIKTIAVNKSKLFSPNKCIKRRIYNKYSNPAQMKNLVVNNNKSKDFKTATIDSQKRREIKRKPIKKNFFGNHRKANSIQILDNSLKKLNNNRKNEKSLSNSKNNRSNNLFSVLRKIIEIKNKNLIKNTPQSSLGNNTFMNNSKKNKKINEDNQDNNINYDMMPYADKKKGNGNRGRNEKYADKNTDSVSFMNKTTYDYYSNNDKNNLNVYYNSIDFTDINQLGKK